MIDKELWDKIEEIRKSGAESQKLHFANYQKPIPNREDMEEKDFVKKIEEIGKVFSEYQNSYSDEYNKEEKRSKTYPSKNHIIVMDLTVNINC